MRVVNTTTYKLPIALDAFIKKNTYIEFYDEPLLDSFKGRARVKIFLAGTEIYLVIDEKQLQATPTNPNVTHVLHLAKAGEVKYHSFPSKAKTSYQISDYTFGQGETIDSKNQTPLLDYFSRGQFEDLADDEKLSTPDFDLMSAGIQVAPGQVYDIPLDMQFTANDFEDFILEETGTSKSASSSNWQAERTMNLSGSRKRIDATQPAEIFGVFDELPAQREKAYKILSKDALESPAQLKEKYFYSYSSAKDYLQSNWPKEQQEVWQILQAETQESDEVVRM